jgi:hypothetical protein
MKHRFPMFILTDSVITEITMTHLSLALFLLPCFGFPIYLHHWSFTNWFASVIYFSFCFQSAHSDRKDLEWESGEIQKPNDRSLPSFRNKWKRFCCHRKVPCLETFSDDTLLTFCIRQWSCPIVWNKDCWFVAWKRQVILLCSTESDICILSWNTIFECP